MRECMHGENVRMSDMRACMYVCMYVCLYG